MTKLYLDNQGNYQKCKEDKINWLSVIAKTIVCLTMVVAIGFYIYLLFSA
jgi:hypothetical protein